MQLLLLLIDRCALLSDTEQRELAELLNNSFKLVNISLCNIGSHSYSIGEVVIYQWVELAREYLDNKSILFIVKP